MDFSSKQKIKAENIIFGNMPAKPNVCVVWQCRQINFKGEGTKYFKKGPLLLSLLFCNYYYSIIVVVATENGDEKVKTWGCGRKVFKSGTFVSISQHRSGYYLLYRCIETYKSQESVSNSFLDAQIKGTKHSF